MGYDNKYGAVTTEHGSIPDDEPVFVFRSQDALLPEVLSHYRQLCAEAGSPQRHLVLIDEGRARVEAWQDGHRTRVPDSESSRAWRD